MVFFLETSPEDFEVSLVIIVIVVLLLIVVIFNLKPGKK